MKKVTEIVAQLAADQELSFPPLDAESLSANYPGLSQSAAQVFHQVDERCRALTEQE